MPVIRFSPVGYRAGTGGSVFTDAQLQQIVNNDGSVVSVTAGSGSLVGVGFVYNLSIIPASATNIGFNHVIRAYGDLDFYRMGIWNPSKSAVLGTTAAPSVSMPPYNEYGRSIPLVTTYSLAQLKDINTTYYCDFQASGANRSLNWKQVFLDVIYTGPDIGGSKTAIFLGENF